MLDIALGMYLKLSRPRQESRLCPKSNKATCPEDSNRQTTNFPFANRCWLIHTLRFEWEVLQCVNTNQVSDFPGELRTPEVCPTTHCFSVWIPTLRTVALTITLPCILAVLIIAFSFILSQVLNLTSGPEKSNLIHCSGEDPSKDWSRDYWVEMAVLKKTQFCRRVLVFLSLWVHR